MLYLNKFHAVSKLRVISTSIFAEMLVICPRTFAQLRVICLRIFAQLQVPFSCLFAELRVICSCIFAERVSYLKMWLAKSHQIQPQGRTTSPTPTKWKNISNRKNRKPTIINKKEINRSHSRNKPFWVQQYKKCQKASWNNNTKDIWTKWRGNIKANGVGNRKHYALRHSTLNTPNQGTLYDHINNALKHEGWTRKRRNSTMNQTTVY